LQNDEEQQSNASQERHIENHTIKVIERETI
jgi:hypothetical protein